MPQNMPVVTGDVLSAATYNSLVQFTVNAQTGTTYTPVLNDQYQVLIVTSNASAKTVSIPTDASVAFPTGTAITFLNTGAGALTINAVSSGTTTITSAGAASAAPTVAQYRSAVAIKTGANAWTVVGAVA